MSETKAGVTTSEFWTNGGFGVAMLVVADRAAALIVEHQATAALIALVACATELALAGAAVAYGLCRTRVKVASKT